MSSKLSEVETSFREKEELRRATTDNRIEMDSGGVDGVFETPSVTNQPQKSGLSSSIRILRHSNTTSLKVLL
ncbi:MAG: hypothetical protein EOO27_36890 [Comamonadaceae bacterium]|nr:MAG: hypothetical protein EOO27_36890 [Comamonadaceae bacterium]